MVGGDFNIPIVHQDLANSTMPPMQLPFGSFYNPSYLGGVKMPRQLDADKVDLINKKEVEDKGNFKKAMIALAVIIGLGSIAPLRKSIKKAGGVMNYVRKLFNKKPTKPGLWKRFKNWAGGIFKSNPNKPSVWSRFKNWMGGIFKSKKQVS